MPFPGGILAVAAENQRNSQTQTFLDLLRRKARRAARKPFGLAISALERDLSVKHPLNSMSVKKGDTIRVHYTGKLTDGTQFDSSEGKAPLEFKVGSGMVVPGFDAAVLDMELGETKTVTIPCEEAYGPRTEDMTVDIPRKEFGEGFTAEVGDKLMIQLGDGMQIPVTITKIDDEIVRIDANHELAGKDLVFTITIAEIVE